MIAHTAGPSRLYCNPSPHRPRSHVASPRRVLAATEPYAVTRSSKAATPEAAAATTSTNTNTAPSAPTVEGGAPTPADSAAAPAAATATLAAAPAGPAAPAPAAPASDSRPEAPRQRAACLVALRGLAELAAAEGRAEEAEVFLCRVGVGMWWRVWCGLRVAMRGLWVH